MDEFRGNSSRARCQNTARCFWSVFDQVWKKIETKAEEGATDRYADGKTDEDGETAVEEEGQKGTKRLGRRGRGGRGISNLPYLSFGSPSCPARADSVVIYCALYRWPSRNLCYLTELNEKSSLSVSNFYFNPNLSAFSLRLSRSPPPPLFPSLNSKWTSFILKAILSSVVSTRFILFTSLFLFIFIYPSSLPGVAVFSSTWSVLFALIYSSPSLIVVWVSLNSVLCLGSIKKRFLKLFRYFTWILIILSSEEGIKAIFPRFFHQINVVESFVQNWSERNWVNQWKFFRCVTWILIIVVLRRNRNKFSLTFHQINNVGSSVLNRPEQNRVNQRKLS